MTLQINFQNCNYFVRTKSRKQIKNSMPKKKSDDEKPNKITTVCVCVNYTAHFNKDSINNSNLKKKEVRSILDGHKELWLIVLIIYQRSARG